MKLDRAEKCVERLVPWLEGFANRVQVAGSIRRRRPEVSDIDLVVIPRYEEEKDIFGNVIARRNTTWKAVDQRCTEEKWRVERAGADIVTFHASGIQVDIFWATPERWGTVLMCRTGSKEHNIWLAQYAQGRGGKWHPGHGLYLNHKIIGETEEAIYGALGSRVIPPEEREIDRLPFASLARTAAQGGSVGVGR